MGAPAEVVNIASVPQRSPFRYAGGKTWFVPTFRQWIRCSAERPKILLEPFAGGGIIGLTAAFEGLADKVVMVELDQDVAAVWQIATSPDYDKLARMITEFEMTREKVIAAIESTPASTVDRAFQTILRNRVCHGGILAPGAGLIKGGENGKGLHSRWYPETLAKRICDIGAIRERIEFIHGSAFDVIPRHAESDRAFIFVDPPYTADKRSAGKRLYRHHELDHKKLFELFQGSGANFLLTYDDNCTIRELALENGFETAVIPMKTNRHVKKEELVISKELDWLRTEKENAWI